MCLKSFLRSLHRWRIPAGRSRNAIVADIQRQALVSANKLEIVTLKLAPDMVNDIEALMTDLGLSMGETLEIGITVLGEITKAGGRTFEVRRHGTPYRYGLPARPRPKPKHDPVS